MPSWQRDCLAKPHCSSSAVFRRRLQRSKRLLPHFLGAAELGCVPGNAGRAARPIPTSRGSASCSMQGRRQALSCMAAVLWLAIQKYPHATTIKRSCTVSEATVLIPARPLGYPRGAVCAERQRFNATSGQCECVPGWTGGRACSSCQTGAACDAFYRAAGSVCSHTFFYTEQTQVKSYVCDFSVRGCRQGGTAGRAGGCSA